MASYPAVGILPPAHALEDGLVQAQLQTGLVEHLPLVAVPGNQPVDLDRLGLANTVTASLGLEDDTLTRSNIRQQTSFLVFSLWQYSAYLSGVFPPQSHNDIAG